MICLKCSTENNYYHLFCYRCGTKLNCVNSKATAEEPRGDAEIQIVFRDPAGKGRRALRKALVCAGFCLLSIAFVGMFALILSGDGNRIRIALFPLRTQYQQIEKVKLQLQQPRSFETVHESVVIKITSDPLAKLSLNGKTLGDSRTGIWTVQIPLDIGDNEFELIAQRDGCLAAREALTITRLNSPLTLRLNTPALSQTDQATFMISGITKSDAAIDASLPLADKSAVDALGRFRLAVQLPTIPGEYEFTVQSDSQGEQTSVKQKVKKLLNEADYIAAAVPVSYSELAANPQNWTNKPLVITGVVWSIAGTTDEGADFILLDKGNLMEKIHVLYDGATPIKKKAALKLYCELKEIQDGQPVVNARIARKASG